MTTLLSILALLILGAGPATAQNVVLVVIDGARYSETLGGGGTTMPVLWNVLRPAGTVWTNFRNEGVTNTVNGHTSIESGTWQSIANDGSERPTSPTIFEYFRRHTGVSDSLACLVVGKGKLTVLSASTDSLYGSTFGARTFVERGDTGVFVRVREVLLTFRPRLLMVNFADVDRMGHSGDWQKYLGAIRTADSLVGCLWKTLQSSPVYRENTVLLVTNDHGRHDDSSGGFQRHGDGCEGCRHIMLLAAGGRFSRGYLCEKPRTQCDLAASVGGIMGFPTPFVAGGSILGDTLMVRQPKETGLAPVLPRLRRFPDFSDAFNSVARAMAGDPRQCPVPLRRLPEQ